MADVVVLDTPRGSVRIENLETSELGRGGYGVVYRGVFGSRAVAVKCCEGRERRTLQQEINAYQRIGAHAHVIEMLGHGLTDTVTFLIMALADGGELYHHVIERNHLSETEARPFFVQMLCAVEHIHTRGVVHRDIKLENWLIRGKDTLVLVDFGLSHIFDPNHPPRRLLDCVGSESYVSPDVLRRTTYDGFACDAWSLSVCLFAMCCGFFPYRCARDDDWRFSSYFGKTPCIVSALHRSYEKPHALSPALCRLLHQSLSSVFGRPSVAQMQRDPWTVMSAQPMQEVDLEKEEHVWKSAPSALESLPGLGRAKPLVLL